jgi:soluble lytic murein transglycosylase-like protein
MSKFQKLLIIQAVLVLFILAALIQLVVRTTSKPAPTATSGSQPIVQLTPAFQKKSNGQYVVPNNAQEKAAAIEKVYEQTPRTSLQTSLAIQKLGLSLDSGPYKTTTFQIGHSAMLGLFYIHVLSDQGENDLKEYLRQFELLNYYQSPQTSTYFIHTETDVLRAIQYDEQKALQFRKQHIDSGRQSMLPSKKHLSNIRTTPRFLASANGAGGATILAQATGLPQEDTESNLNTLMNIFRTATSFDFGQAETGNVSGGGNGSLNNTNLPNVTGTLPTNTKINQVFNEAGAKIGVPPKLVRAFMRVECGSALSAFDTSDALVTQYTAVGAKYTDSCDFNYECLDAYGYQDALLYCAQGLMQFMPGTWVGYANTVNEYGYTRASTNPWNLLDATYAAAKKIKLDSGNTDPNNWTDEQIKAAQKAYFGAADGGYITKLYEELSKW